MCAMPRIADPQNYCGAIYDAWNRLVQYGDASGTWYYRYDGLNRRVGKKSNLDGATWRHYYYNDQWQCLEERTENPVPPYGLRAYPSHRYVWGLRYVDDLILRQRDVTSDGTIDETLYALQDANFNVVARRRYCRTLRLRRLRQGKRPQRQFHGQRQRPLQR